MRLNLKHVQIIKGPPPGCRVGGLDNFWSASLICKLITLAFQRYHPSTVTICPRLFYNDLLSKTLLLKSRAKTQLMNPRSSTRKAKRPTTLYLYYRFDIKYYMYAMFRCLVHYHFLMEVYNFCSGDCNFLLHYNSVNKY